MKMILLVQEKQYIHLGQRQLPLIRLIDNYLNLRYMVSGLIFDQAIADNPHIKRIF